MFIRLVLIMTVVGFLTGCASTGTQPSAVNQLQIRVAQLETQVDAQDQDIADIKASIGGIGKHIQKTSRPLASVTIPEVKPYDKLSSTPQADAQGILRVPVDPQKVQKALKAAGYYNGAIDGKLGTGSQSAIRKFQVENELVSDGIIGKRTWARLKEYLD